MDNDKYIGRLLDNRYEIQEVIGVGGMAIVYKAMCHRLNRPVAVKILKDEYSQDEEFRRRFHAEGQAVAMLSHSNIVSVYDVSTTDEANYIVMELIDGISLKQYMEKKGILNWKETLHFAIQICKALEHAHSRGIVHRDIKPHNVMVLKNGSVKVADFGIARVMSKSNTLTKEALGSVHYISPEQAKGGRVDDRSDLYSLGVVMYEMITGRPPYDGESPVAVAIQHINGGARMPSMLNPNIPGGLEQIIMKAMAHDPAGRYSSATAMLYDMDEFRKLPTILFDYNTPPTDAAIKLGNRTEPRQEPRVEPRPRTDAERAAAAAAARRNRPPQRGASTRQPPKTTQPRRSQPPRSRRADYEEEEEGSKAATIAIIACSAVAVIAIVIFLIVLLGGGIGETQQMVSVPTLVGKVYDTLQTNPDLVIGEPTFVHDDTYEKGRIMEQNPKPGDKVPVGTEITIKVSLGPVPEALIMEDLIGQPSTTAENYLTAQGLLVLFQEEHNENVPTGRVCRTDPEAGKPLEKGQKVTLYLSLGSAAKTQQMPTVSNRALDTVKMILDNQDMDLTIQVEEEESLEVAEGNVIRSEPAEGEELRTGDTVILYVSTGAPKVQMPNLEGKTLEVAQDLLKYAKFTEVTVEEEETTEYAPGIVIWQSIAPGKDEEDTIPINTPIVLKVSKAPTPVQKEYTLELPREDVQTELKIVLKGSDGKEYSYSINDGRQELKVMLEGNGQVTYEVYINDEHYETFMMDFDA